MRIAELSVAFQQQMQRLAEQVASLGPAFRSFTEMLAAADIPSYAPASSHDCAEDPRDRALRLRRNRNTGPPDRRRLDGSRQR